MRKVETFLVQLRDILMMFKNSVNEITSLEEQEKKMTKKIMMMKNQKFCKPPNRAEIKNN